MTDGGVRIHDEQREEFLKKLKQEKNKRGRTHCRPAETPGGFFMLIFQFGSCGRSSAWALAARMISLVLRQKSQSWDLRFYTFEW